MTLKPIAPLLFLTQCLFHVLQIFRVLVFAPSAHLPLWFSDPSSSWPHATVHTQVCLSSSEVGSGNWVVSDEPRVSSLSICQAHRLFCLYRQAAALHSAWAAGDQMLWQETRQICSTSPLPYDRVYKTGDSLCKSWLRQGKLDSFLDLNACGLEEWPQTASGSPGFQTKRFTPLQIQMDHLDTEQSALGQNKAIQQAPFQLCVPSTWMYRGDVIWAFFPLFSSYVLIWSRQLDQSTGAEKLL